jgi:hypothetical protein
MHNGTEMSCFPDFGKTISDKLETYNLNVVSEVFRAFHLNVCFEPSKGPFKAVTTPIHIKNPLIMVSSCGQICS